MRHETMPQAAGAPAPSTDGARVTGARKRPGVGGIGLAFGMSMLLFLIGPALAGSTFEPYPMLRWGEVMDLLTPVIILPVAWLLFRAAAPAPPSSAEVLAFVAVGAVWVEGQGIHLAANAIGHLSSLDTSASGQATLVHDLDEVLSHVLWHAAILGLSALTLARAWSAPLVGVSGWTLAAIVGAAFLYGATFFAIVVEGQTATFALPIGGALAAATALAARSGLRQRPVATLFVLGYLVALILAAIWAGMNDWHLVEFSEAGLIR